mmetsp:Transcript_13460/g.25627  ORF Transcript_13460/g.25627 Transcript_13460/m.25627 type:complete len:163 (+) Transcript_13460:363-851(+)
MHTNHFDSIGRPGGQQQQQQQQCSLSPPPPPQKAPSPAPAPSSDIFAELGLAAHPQFPHHHQHHIHQAPAPLAFVPQRTSISAAPVSSPSTWRPTGTAATTTATAAAAALPTKTFSTAPKQQPQPSRAPAQRIAAESWGDDTEGFGDDWGNEDDLDDLLLDD